MIYLDNGATTFPKPEVVYQAMDIFARTGAVNAGRGAYAAARAADQMIKNVRTGLISLMDAREQAQVVLTPSVTIALNQIIYGQAWTEKSIAYVSPYEHNSVLRPLDVLSKKSVFRCWNCRWQKICPSTLLRRRPCLRRIPPLSWR